MKREVVATRGSSIRQVTYDNMWQAEAFAGKRICHSPLFLTRPEAEAWLHGVMQAWELFEPLERQPSPTT